jgi:hypothetical protein
MGYAVSRNAASHGPRPPVTAGSPAALIASAASDTRPASASLYSEAAALYAFAKARNVPVICLAHVTNTMGLAGRDFEKGEADGTADALEVLAAIAGEIRKRRRA